MQVITLTCQQTDGDEIVASAEGHVDGDNLASMLAYATEIAEDVMAGRRSLSGNPWVLPAVVHGRFEGGSPHPLVFIWAPEKLLADFRLPCPTCAHATSFSELHTPRIVHTLSSHYLYVCTKHLCYYCSGSNSTSKRPRTKMSADLPAVMACLPSSLKQYWRITTTGMALFDVEVLDHVRSMATRTSWSALADGINEVKCAEWARRCRYTKQCSARLPNSLKVNHKLLRNLYMRHASERHEVSSHGGVVYVKPQLDSINVSEILCFDWTVVQQSAAVAHTFSTRCVTTIKWFYSPC